LTKNSILNPRETGLICGFISQSTVCTLLKNSSIQEAKPFIP